MLIDEYHPEDIKAAIRKRYRSVVRFEMAEKLAKGSVAEILRGRRTQRTEAAVRRIMRDEDRTKRSIDPVHSIRLLSTHRQNAEAV